MTDALRYLIGPVRFVGLAIVVAALCGCGNHTGGQAKTPETNGASALDSAQINRSVNVSDKIVKNDDEWRALLTPEQYRVARECGTEPPFTGKYYNFKGDGTYLCVACGSELFSSTTKYDSGSGWPSFYAPLSEEKIEERTDRSHGMVRVEVRCNRCGAHLGHVFEDGPAPTGLRYCINSAALDFSGKADAKAKAEQDTTKNTKSGGE